MPRALPRVLILAAVCVAVVLGTAAPALAASPSPAPTPTASVAADSVTYTGSYHVVSHHMAGGTGRDLTKTITYLIVCAEPGHCTIRTTGTVVTLTNGTGSRTVTPSGDPCAIQTWMPEATITVAATLTTLSVTTHQAGVADVVCNGTHESVDSQDTTFEGTLSGGTACLIDASCTSASPRAVAGGPVSGAAGGPRVGSTPSVLSALPTAAVAATPRNALWAAAAAVILVLLIALPTQLFNSASEKASERLGAWWARVRPRRRRPAEEDAAVPSSGEVAAGPSPEPPHPPGIAWAGWPLAAAGVLAASVISAFVDPAIAFDAAGLRTVLSILVSFLLDVVIGWFALLFIVRRTRPDATASFEFKPLTLVIVALAVLITRLTGFQPGIVFGLVAGVAFGGLLGTAKARVALIGLGYSFAVGLLAWLGYSILSGGGGEHPGAVRVFIEETLSSAAIAGIAALPIALLPVGALVGREVWRWNRAVWAVAYGIGLVAFFLVLMPMPFAWAEVPLSLWTWIGLYLAYAVAAVVVWLVVTRPWRAEEAGENAAGAA